jgi:uncharacterized membrane protein
MAMAGFRTSTSSASRAGAAGAASEPGHNRRLGSLLRALLWLGTALVLAGTALELSQRGGLQHAMVRFTALPAGLAALQGNALLTLGVLVFLASPPVSLAYLTLSFLRAGEWRYAAAAAVVLAIVLGGMALAIP